MAALEEISSVLQSGGENVTGSLRDLVILLEANDTSSFVQTVLGIVPLTVIFRYLQSGNSDQTMLACSVLEKVLTKIPPAELVKISTYIELGLQFSNPSIKRACLTALDKNSEAISSTITAPTMFHLITQILADESLKCAKLASNILLKFLSHPSHLSSPVREALIIDLSGIMQVSSTVRYRVYELGVRAVVSRDSEAFALISSSGLLESLIGELEVDDILAQLNCVELLLILLESQEGVGLLERKGVVGKLHTLLVSAEQDPFGSAIIPGLIKFFGHMSVSVDDVPALVRQYPRFLSLVFHFLPNPHDSTMWSIAIDTFALLGSKVNTRKALLEQSGNTEQSLRTIGNFVANAATEVRVRALSGIAQILSCPESPDEESVSHKWYLLLGAKFFSTLMSVVRQPFPELRHNGLKVLAVLAPSEWGQREMNAYGSFLEYLTDRSTEKDKEGKKLKYETVHTMATASCAEEVWGNVDLMKLKKYDREGPFYFLSDSTVATEGSA